MSSNTPINSDNQEIDLSQVSRRIGLAYESFLNWIFRGILFVKRNIIILAVLFIVGAGLGFYFDKETKVYDHELIVTPNFGSVEYLYSKIDLIDSKIREKDKVFLKSIGIKNPKQFSEIDIEPINDVYGFASQKEQNFDLIKLMAEDGDINKVIENPITSRNYKNHRIKIKTDGAVSRKEIIDPILDYLNKNDYLSEIQESVIRSNNLKLAANEKTIAQIDALLNNFSENTNPIDKNDKMVFYNNENTQLNDVLLTKSQLIQDQANIKIDLITISDIIKENSVILNIKNNKSINGKMKIVIPFLFIGLFLFFGMVRSFYRIQMAKYKA